MNFPVVHVLFGEIHFAKQGAKCGAEKIVRWLVQELERVQMTQQLRKTRRAMLQQIE